VKWNIVLFNPPSPTGPNSRCVNSSSSRREWWNLFTRSKFNQTAW